MSRVTGSGNVADYLGAMAARCPDAPALHVARAASTISFATLEGQVERLATGLAAAGVRPGDRVLVMLRPELAFVATAFALLRLGAIPVFADPGLGPRWLFACIQATAPRGLIAVPALHAARSFRPRPFRSVTVAVASGWWPGTIPFEALANAPANPPPVAAVDLDAVAIIAFTTGSTGEPKGVSFTHRVLHAQLAAFRAFTGIGEGDTQLAVLPLLAILGPGLGCATVLPDMDPRRPARADPRKLVSAINRYGVTHGFASPTLWHLLTAHCESNRIALPTFRRLLVGGAPVAADLVERARRVIGRDGEVHVVYGATEAVPVTSATDGEVLAAATTTPAEGTLLGRPIPPTEVRLVRVVDGAITSFPEEIAAPRGRVGEIVVRGDIVTPSYFGRPDADALAKIPSPAGPWHRMGDLGRFDAEGRLWFCGRKSERIETEAGTLYTTWTEPAFEAHPRVARAAVVGVGSRPRQRSVLVVEPAPGHFPLLPSTRRRFANELRARGTPSVSAVLFHRALPLDVRHNAKILRNDLAHWAEKRLR
jgi:acyl-CoA synthetase (AMP-forming)/AMP-acid ligase II